MFNGDTQFTTEDFTNYTNAYQYASTTDGVLCNHITFHLEYQNEEYILDVSYYIDSMAIEGIRLWNTSSQDYILLQTGNKADREERDVEVL